MSKENFTYRRPQGIKAQPVYHNWEVFDKIYLNKKQIQTWIWKSEPTVRKMIDEWEILEFIVRDKKIYIVKNDFLKYLAKD